MKIDHRREAAAESTQELKDRLRFSHLVLNDARRQLRVVRRDALRRKEKQYHKHQYSPLLDPRLDATYC